jgi:uncharacterized coiled-coil protein SlyX
MSEVDTELEEQDNETTFRLPQDPAKLLMAIQETSDTIESLQEGLVKKQKRIDYLTARLQEMQSRFDEIKNSDTAQAAISSAVHEFEAKAAQLRAQFGITD